MYQKSTYTSSGNLLLSSKKQSLLTMSIWSTKLTDNKNQEFIIRKRKATDSILMLFSKQISKLNIGNGYVIKTNQYISKEISNHLICITKLFKNKSVYTIELKDKILKIELRTEKHHLDVFEKIINL